MTCTDLGTIRIPLDPIVCGFILRLRRHHLYCNRILWDEDYGRFRLAVCPRGRRRDGEQENCRRQQRRFQRNHRLALALQEQDKTIERLASTATDVVGDDHV